MSGKLLREAEQSAQKKKILRFGEMPSIQPLQKTEPVVNSEPLREITPVENSRGTPSVFTPEPLQTEPVRKSTPLQKTEPLSPDTPHLRIPYMVWENVLRKLKPAPRAVLEELYRAAAGWHSDECTISIPTLSKHCTIVPTQIRQHLKKLESDGYITRLDDVVGGSNLTARGIRFRVNLPRITPIKNRTPSENQPPQKTEPNKDKDLNKDSKRGSASPDFKSCPVCNGTGFRYVDELDRSRGVEKCKHETPEGEK